MIKMLTRFAQPVAVAALVLAAGIGPAHAAALDISQRPLYLASSDAAPPLNMLVMGRDHKLYYEAYNDASDLNGDGVLDIGYRGWELKTGTVPTGTSPYKIDYYGYFNSFVCYNFSAGVFTPASATTNKQCSNRWSGDFLNYLTTGRGDALKKVLYGGDRITDTATSTVLQTNYVTHDAHSWGKEYFSVARDGYNIANYAPMTVPTAGRYHLFAVTSLTNPSATNADGGAPVLRVLRDSPYRIWEWVSIEGPVADTRCLHGGNGPDCTLEIPPSPGHPGSRAAFDTMEATYGIATNQYGNAVTRSAIDCSSADCNPNGSDDDYMTIVTGRIDIKQAGFYRFRINGDDNIDLRLTLAGLPAGSGGCYPTAGRGFGGDCGGNDVLNLTALSPGVYDFKFRMEEGTGGDGYRLEWERRSAANGGGNTNGNLFSWRVLRTNGTDTVANNASEEAKKEAQDSRAAGGYESDPTFRFYNLRPPRSNGSTRDADRFVRVSVCPSTANLRESNCKRYTDGNYKPTGILHDYGETDRMFFGLITGSQISNLEGGILRKNMTSFTDEVNPANGVFVTSRGTANVLDGADGIVGSIRSLRMIGGSGGEGSNWAWGGGTGDCTSLGFRAIENGECRMWGNPIGEMMFEGLRYFAGSTAFSGFTSAPSGHGNGAGEETTMGLAKATWKDPYKAVADGGLGHLACAKPVMTVVSDIYPSYDSNLPGNPWSTVTMDLPTGISDFSAATMGSRIWNHEFGGGRNVYIGQVGTAESDAAPSAKAASSFGNIRGLSPEEPTKEGTYYAAAVAHYGAINERINTRSRKSLSTYAVAVASPLPKIEFPISGGTMTLLPFAKTVSGTFGDQPRKPTNTIVDFYVEKIVNLPGQPTDAALNGGRGYAVFRINYEDVEQGNDHDMDAIVRYEVLANQNGTVTVNLRSEYAAGGANHAIGYTMSGTTKDGIYLEVCDLKDGQGNDGTKGSCSHETNYIFNTPPNRDPGYCLTNPTAADCAFLPPVATRTFTGGTSSATTLRDPLWYAAKYGGFKDDNLNGLPDGTEWDANNDGTPDNYFLVTNASTLKDQLARAFSQIITDTRTTGGVAASGTRREAGFLAYVPEYNSADWTGDLRAHEIIRNEGAANDGDLRLPARWTAKQKLATRLASDRKIFFVDKVSTTTTLKPFLTGGSGLGTTAAEIAGKLGVATNYPATIHSSVTFDFIVNHLRGDAAQELKNGGRLRDRSGKMGDILGSQPTVLTTASYGYSSLGGGGAGTIGEAYRTFLTAKQSRVPVVFVGANDGMLHAFNASTGADGGKELFAIIPNSVLPQVHKLVEPAYQHRYYVDASPVQGDAYIGGAWKTVLLAPTGAGGRSVMALDVTDPGATSANPANSLLWEFTDPDLGLTIGQASITVLQDGRWVALIPNGYNSNNYRSYLFVVDLATGTLLHKIDLGTGGSLAAPNGSGSVLAVDTGPDTTGSDAKADIIYAADYYGNVLRMAVLTGDIAPPTVLFTATDGATTPQRQMITGGLGAAFHHVRGQMVFFGTGRYMLTGDNLIPTLPQTQSFYGIWDDNGTTVPRNKLQQQTLNGTPAVIDWSTQKGWRIDLPEGGERFIGVPEVSTGRVIFTSFVPIGDPCTPGGRNYLNVVNITSGTGGLGAPLPTDAVPNPNPIGREIISDEGGGGGPVPSPPVVSTPPQPECDPTSPTCLVEPICTEDSPFDCETRERAEARGCRTDLGILLSDGINNFDSLTCGRQSWRQIR